MLKIIILIILIIVLIFTAFLYLRNRSHMKQIEDIREMLTANIATQGKFKSESIDTLPAVARRYLNHAIEAGTTVAQGVELHMQGSIRLNTNADWIPFTATQTIRAGQGFVWQPHLTARGFLKMSGADYYFGNKARLYFSIFGLIPIVNATGDEISQSAAGRFLIEGIWLPTEYLPRNGARWQAESDSTARIIQSVDRFSSTITIRIDATGKLLSVKTLRLQEASGEFIPFGATIDEERQFNGYRIPSKVKVGWNFGSENYAEFFRTEILDAHFY
jgi:hypothetical protein